MLLAREPGLAPLGRVQLGVVPAQRPHGRGLAALGRADGRAASVLVAGRSRGTSFAEIGSGAGQPRGKPSGTSASWDGGDPARVDDSVTPGGLVKYPAQAARRPVGGPAASSGRTGPVSRSSKPSARGRRCSPARPRRTAAPARRRSGSATASRAGQRGEHRADEAQPCACPSRAGSASGGRRCRRPGWRPRW